MKKYLLFYFLFFSIQTYFSQETRYINTELLNVRSGPGKNYEVLDTAPRGEKVTVLSAKGSWTQIQMDSGIKGFASSKFLTDKQTPIIKEKDKSYSSWQVLLAVVGFVILAKFFDNKRKSTTPRNPVANSNPDHTVSSQPIKSIFICKFCGTESITLLNLTKGSCRKSLNGSHQPFEGVPRKRYNCKFCGTESLNLLNLTKGNCKNSTNDYHQPYEGEQSKKYSCKYCGAESLTILNLTKGNCRNSPNNHHQPII